MIFRKRKPRKLIKELRLAEDGIAPANCVGTGAIGGAGVGPSGEPGVSKKHNPVMSGILRRKPAKEKNA